MRKVLATLSTAGVAIVICLGAWLLFAPAELGGSTRYAVVEGASMQPALQRGDLVLVRGGGNPSVGDVVLYRDPALGVRVLHRVIRVENGRLVVQGDANDFVDDARPLPSEVVGSLDLGPACGIGAPLAAGAAARRAPRVRADAGRARWRCGSHCRTRRVE